MKFDKSMIWKSIVLFIINALLLVSFYFCIISYQNSPTVYLVLAIFAYYVLPIFAIVYGIISWLLTKNFVFPNLLLIICLGVIPGTSFFIISILLAAGSFITELIVRAITKASVPKKQTEEEQFGNSVLIDSKSEK